MNLQVKFCMNSPLVSIIVPVYNVEKYIRPCLDSILAQTFTDWECILVDDGSQDNSGKICDEYARKDGRFVVVHKQNEGVAKARITAFEHSKGELITFIDSDDYVDKNYISHLYECTIKYSADLVGCQYCKSIDGNIIPESRGITGFLSKSELQAVLCENALYNYATSRGEVAPYLNTKMIKRGFLADSLLFGDGLWMGEDLICVLHVLLKVESVYISKETHYYYVSHDGQTTKIKGTKRLYADIKLCEKIEALDKGQFFKSQLADKLFGVIREFLLSPYSMKLSFSQFKEVFYEIIETNIIKHYLVLVDEKKYSVKRKFLLFMIKKKSTMLLWLCCQIIKGGWK